MTPGTFRKKPVVIQAVQWDGSTHGAMEIVHWIHDNGGSAQLITIDISHSISITTLEGEMYALPGWWVIRGIEGEFYPCKDTIFRESYEAAMP